MNMKRLAAYMAMVVYTAGFYAALITSVTWVVKTVWQT